MSSFKDSEERKLVIEDMSWIAVEDAVVFGGLHPLRSWGVVDTQQAEREEAVVSAARLHILKYFRIQKKLSGGNRDASNTNVSIGEPVIRTY